MKRSGNLFQQIIEPTNIAVAHHNAKKGKGHYSEVKMVESNKDRYLAEIHQLLKEGEQLRYYIRYSDDGVILHRDKKELSNLLRKIESYLGENLKLELNPKTQVFPVEDRGVDFLGYRSFSNYTLLRKSSATRFERKLRFIQANYRDLEPQYIVSSLMSHLGWLSHCDSYNFCRKYIFNPEVARIMEYASEQCGIGNPLVSYMVRNGMRSNGEAYSV